MASPSARAPQPSDDTNSIPTWTYPTRFCRICREDVPPTVTMYPPGLPISLQKPIVEYVNEDEYGRLIKPCMCRGGMRYIHELCLLRSRTENTRVGSMWKCHECGHKFNFQKLAIQRWLSSKYSSGMLTVMVMFVLMFVLGFVADPILNLYADPYDTLMGKEAVWSEVRVSVPAGRGASWIQHFLKGFISMGLVGFLKTYILNPFQFWTPRPFAAMGMRRTSTTGRDRATNINLLAVVIGLSSAFYFFYRWVQAIVQKTLQRIGNNIVDTQLPGDDDDLKPPPGWRPQKTDGSQTETSNPDARAGGGESVSADVDAAATSTSTETSGTTIHQRIPTGIHDERESNSESNAQAPIQPHASATSLAEMDELDNISHRSPVHDAISQGWSFADL